MVATNCTVLLALYKKDPEALYLLPLVTVTMVTVLSSSLYVEILVGIYIGDYTLGIIRWGLYVGDYTLKC